MIEITKHQEAVLTRMANGSKYVSASSIESDGRSRELVEQIFAEDMQLVEWGLVCNVSSNPKESRVIAEMKADDGRDYFILKSTPMVNLMFGRGRCKRAIN